MHTSEEEQRKHAVVESDSTKKKKRKHKSTKQQLDLFSVVESTKRQPPAIPFAVALLALGSVRGLGQKGMRSLVRHFQDNLGDAFLLSVEEITGLFSLAKVHGGDKLAVIIAADRETLIAQGEAELRELEANSVYILPPSKLPATLRSIPDPPHWLFVEGEPEILKNRPMVAVVGTRTPTENGRRAAAFVAKAIAAYPISLVSGLAEGIDEEAHRSSLSWGIKNVAFLGHGIETVFPITTGDIRQQIVKSRGAVVTEYFPWEKYQKHYFVERNRLQAGLADLVIPIEAKITGGTAHTIRYAQRFSRPVVGLRWPGVNSLPDELAKEGCQIIDIFTPEGYRRLDSVFRGLVERAGKEAYSLTVGERNLFREIKSRDVPQKDIKRLIRALQAELKEPTNGSGEQSGHS